MATVLNQIGNPTSSIAASTTNFYGIVANSRFSATTEANITTIWRTGGTLSNLYINILTNDRAASTFRTRKATANANLVVSITGSTTGKFEDTSNTDTVTAGDDWHVSLATGAGGTVFTVKIISVLFSATTNTVSMIGGAASTSVATASATNPGPLYAGGAYTAGATDANVGITLRTAGTGKNLFVYVGSNARTTTSTFRSRVNSGFGNLTLDVAGGTTGSFQDIANSDVLASGNLINYSLTTGTGTESISYRTVAIDFETTNGNSQFVVGANSGLSQSAGVTTYYAIAGALVADTTEANQVAETNLAFTASLLQCNISANTIVLDSTLTLRKNSGAANQTVTITALTTGIFQDTTNTDSILASDTLDYEIVTPSTLTAITIRSISLLGDSTVASASVPISSSVFRRTFSGIGTGIGKRQVHGW